MKLEEDITEIQEEVSVKAQQDQARNQVWTDPHP